MRSEFAKAIQKLAQTDEKIVFLTGDLGFNAFEDLADVLKNRFINAGVAEQNMIDVAAGMAYAGLNPWTYSIAPFLILKTVEQIRNNICHRNLPVKMIGNGGGYGYGIMGTTHHILEDISVLSAFPNIKLFIPAFKSDLEPIVKKMNNYKGPSYLRLGISDLSYRNYSGFRNISSGSKITIAVLGPMIKNTLEAIKQNTEADIWVITEIPFKIPKAFYDSVSKTKKLLTIEEHAYQGGFGQMLMGNISSKSLKTKVTHLNSQGYTSKLYGSQAFHLKESGLNSTNIRKCINKMING